MHRAKGKLRYSLKKESSDQDWWLVLDQCPEEIGKLYRNLYWLEHNKGRKLNPPYWGAHVTVVRNEEPPNKEFWWKHEGETIEFQYAGPVGNNCGPDRYRSFWWVQVTCPRLDEIREELGLPAKPHKSYHMTIGSQENEKNYHIYEAIKNGV